jgi:tetratricopeptide (TPR) repeat protein
VQPETLVTAFLSTPEGEVLSFLAGRRADLDSPFIAELERVAERLRLENPRQALQATDRLQQVAAFLADEALQASALRIKGNLLIQMGRYTDSIACYTEARDIRARRGETLEVARLQVGWTAALKNLDRHAEALDLALTTRPILAQHEKWDWLANLEMNIGSLYRLTDRFADALAMYAECQRHFLQAGNPVGAAQSAVNQARALSSLDRFSEALALLRQARATFAARQKWDPLARADMNLGTLFLWMGRYHEAWESYNRAWEGFRQQGNEMETAIVGLYRAQVSLDLNLFPEALEAAQHARQVCERLEMARYVAVAEFCQGRACRGLGRSTEALALLARARQFFASPAGAATWAAIIDLEQAALLRETGQPAEALRALMTASDVFSGHRHTIRLAQTQLMLAECRRDLGEHESARRLYRAILDLPSQPSLAYRAHYGLGQVEEARQHLGAARRHYRAAVRQIESIRRGLRVDEFKASFLDDKLAVYQAAVRLSLAQNDLTGAFDMVERAKSSALLDWLARSLEIKSGEGEATDPQAWERLRQLKEAWAWHYSRLEKPPTESAENGLRAASPGDDHWKALRQVEASFSQALRHIQGHRLAFLTLEASIPWEAVARWLGPDDLLVEYFCLGDDLLAFLIDIQGLRVVKNFPYSLREIRRSAGVLDLALKRLRGLSPTYIQEVLEPLARRHLRWLYQALVAPLEIGERQKIIFLPDNVLHYLPFQALYDGERYLVERCELQYAPSASVLAHCCTARAGRVFDDSRRPALILGYSNAGQLQHVLDEVRTVAAALPAARLFEEAEATLAHLRQHCADSRLVHIASHATFRADNPLFSSIQMADEPLNVIDLYHLDLPALLVTLSACETGVNQLKGGDLFGLARGCLYAGAPSVVVSLWQVDDASTAALMQAFYRRLQGGNRLGGALRAAQLDFLQSEGRPTRHPHYWAPFCLIGADDYVF